MPLVAWLLFAAAATLLFLTLWIYIPGWTYSLLVLAVGAPEYSAWLVVASVVVCALTITTLGSSRLSQMTFIVALLAAALASTPVVRVTSVVQRFDTEMTRAFGVDVLGGSVLDGADATRTGRTRPLVVFELLRGVAFGDVRIARGIPFASPGGVPLTVTVYRPNGTGVLPVVAQIYGGAWQRGSPDDNQEFARYVAAQGYVVIAIDYRHAPRWTWPAQMEDVRAALHWIHEHAQEYGADVSRLAVIGRSAGAHLALLAAYGQGGPRVRAVVSFYGPVDLEDGYRHPPRPDPLDVRAIDEAFLGATPDEQPARYREASPITYATRPLPPTLLIYGTRDHVVEARFGRMLRERLLAVQTPAALLEIPWAEHGFDAVPSGPSAQLSLYYTERFLAWALRAD